MKIKVEERERKGQIVVFGGETSRERNARERNDGNPDFTTHQRIKRLFVG